MGGILKNAVRKEEGDGAQEAQSLSDFRKQVYKNTQLNAQLTSRKRDTPIDTLHLNENGEEEDVTLSPSRRRGPPKDTLLMKREHDALEKQKEEMKNMTEEERLQWNQKNLDENEIAKQQFQDIHVDEPKTPYQGAVDPEGEYYKVDDDEEDDDDDGKKKQGHLDDLDDFSLGEPEYKVSATADNGIIDAEDDESDAEPEELTPEEKHRRFEEMRKKHYNVKEVFRNKQALEDLDDDEDDE